MPTTRTRAATATASAPDIDDAYVTHVAVATLWTQEEDRSRTLTLRLEVTAGLAFLHFERIGPAPYESQGVDELTLAQLAGLVPLLARVVDQARAAGFLPVAEG